MKNHRFAALLCLVFAFAATGCGTPRAGVGEKKGRRATLQTGTNIPRWQFDAPRGREARAKQRAAKPNREKRDAKKPKAEKPKRERQQRRARSGDEEVITRGGFR